MEIKDKDQEAGKREKGTEQNGDTHKERGERNKVKERDAEKQGLLNGIIEINRNK